MRRNSIVADALWRHYADRDLINDGRQAYTWDAANRLVKVVNLKTGQATSFGYDGLGRRLVIGEQAAGGSPVRTDYLWCGGRVCGARNAAGQVIADYYAQGEQHDRYNPAGKQDASDLYYTKDQLGSIIGVMDAKGHLHGTTEYTAYGAVRQTRGAQADFGYAGMLYNGATGLYLTQYREYAPTAGRWLSRDPIGIMGGENIYAYAYDDPTVYADRNGQDPIGAIVGFVGGAIWGGVSGWISGDRNECLWVDIGTDAAFGGLAGLTDGFSLLAIGTRAGLGVAGAATQAYANGESFTGGDAAAAASVAWLEMWLAAKRSAMVLAISLARTRAVPHRLWGPISFPVELVSRTVRARQEMEISQREGVDWCEARCADEASARCSREW